MSLRWSAPDKHFLFAETHRTPKQDGVFCGDNDIFPLPPSIRNMLVRNKDEQLADEVKQAMQSDLNLQAYLAKGGFKGLNGYYTSGVIEGAYHYGIFDGIETSI